MMKSPYQLLKRDKRAFLTPTEARPLLGYKSMTSIYRLIKEGSIPVIERYGKRQPKLHGHRWVIKRQVLLRLLKKR